MKVKIVFLNEKGLIEREANTRKVKEKKVYYKLQPFPLSLFEKESELPIDLNLCLFDLKKKQYLAFYQNEKQLSLMDIQKLDLKDYLQNFKIAELTKQLSLQKPEGFEKYMPLITFIAILTLILFSYFMIKDVVNSLNARFDVLNKSIQIMEKNQELFINVTKTFNNKIGYISR